MAKALGGVAIVETPAALAAEATELFVRSAAEAIGDRGRFAVALAGGATPRGLYTTLAGEPARARVDWRRTWVFFGDERCVPPTDPESNYRMAWETLLGTVPVPPGQIFRIAGEATDGARAAADYEATLRAVLEPGAGRCDLILLGMGLDGHVASLFPGSPQLAVEDRRATSGPAGLEPWVDRVTMTMPELRSALRIVFLVAGATKADAVVRAFAGEITPDVPASLLRLAPVRVEAFLDRAAASKLGAG